MKPCSHSKCVGKKRCLLTGRWIDYHDYGAQFNGEQAPVQGKPGTVVQEGEKEAKAKVKIDFEKLKKAVKKGIPKDTDLAKSSQMSNRPASKDEGVLSNMKKRLKRYIRNPPNGVNLKRIPKADRQATTGKEPASSNEPTTLPPEAELKRRRSSGSTASKPITVKYTKPKKAMTWSRQGGLKATVNGQHIHAQPALGSHSSSDPAANRRSATHPTKDDEEDSGYTKLSKISRKDLAAFTDKANKVKTWGKDSPARARVNARQGGRDLHRMSREDPSTFKAIRTVARLKGKMSEPRKRKEKIANANSSSRDKLKRMMGSGLRDRVKQPERTTESRERSSQMILSAIAKMYNEGR
jgi:hypothetical protein